MRTYITMSLSPVLPAGVVNATGSVPQSEPRRCLFSFKKIISTAAGGYASQRHRPSRQRWISGWEWEWIFLKLWHMVHGRGGFCIIRYKYDSHVIHMWNTLPPVTHKLYVTWSNRWVLLSNGAHLLLQKAVREIKVVGERGEGELLSLFL